MSTFHSLTIKELKKESKNAISIVFHIPSELKKKFQFIAGQYITIKKQLAGKELRRAYSICSAPNSGEFRIAVKAVDNGYFSVFATTILKQGDMLEVSTPEGKFRLETAETNKKNYLGIAAGSGITPIMAMIKGVLTEEPNSTFTLIYGNKTIDDTIFKNEIDALIQKYLDRFIVQYVFSRVQIEGALFGRIDQGNINFVKKHKIFDKAFLCGPADLINIAKKTLVSSGMEASSIYFELFSTPVLEIKENIEVFDEESEITIILDGEKTTIFSEIKSTVLAAALKEGIDVPYSCQGGICSSCLAKITEGEVRMIKNIILSEEEVKNGLILTCQAHPTTQKITIDYDDI
ncbi:2Fe-2S iron-sulfur cluster-binding protein [Lutibacter sp.]|uniref:2Fe-2S iron-sulfur cluster-binding protein n=1 Tax=Lutibacter sp. TaxID=1925666 RepID=UPI00273621B6|nr:2Fe-2S iron-sulfur cluster-binding protein [Lutibacter sp.]MDP3313188.1 2Fe-2S iron-sulfur cluster-binding protein [Lutibacter sp.]